MSREALPLDCLRRPRCRGTKPGTTIVVAIALISAFGGAAAQEFDESPPRGRMMFTYQSQKTRDLVTSHGLVRGGLVRTQLIDFDVNYRIKDRWTINVGLPLISREWQGGRSHNPLNIVPPQLDSDFVDDGQYHVRS